MEDANTHQKSREATRGREAATIGLEPSKEQYSHRFNNKIL
jgi:hypothetical protein